MKKCPYCAEEIQNEAIKCRYCHSDLTVPPPTAQPATASTAAIPETGPSTAPTADPSIRYTHSGYRYVLGFGADYFGIWDRQSPTAPAERFPRNDDGWRQAWTRFVGLEPGHVPVPDAGQEPGASVAAEPSDSDAMQYTHSGQRYLLGYGRTFFGIWDRQLPSRPMERFARDDAGWAAAWRRFTQLETHYTEVGLGGGPAGSAGAGSGTGAPSA